MNWEILTAIFNNIWREKWKCEPWSFYSVCNKESVLLGHDALSLVNCNWTFQRTIAFSSSWVSRSSQAS